MDRLQRVPLRVVAELGGCTLPVAEVLALGDGSVVALDRAAGDLVDLRVNEILVARGELVAIDDRYGVRITELAAEP